MADKSFLDSISDGITNAVDSVAGKAKKMGDTSSLKSQIRGQEKIVNNMYLEIAKKYYDDHKDDSSDPYAAQMQEISSAKKRIGELKAEIEALNS